MANLDIYNSVRAVPETAKKKISGGRISGFTDINPMWRIMVLTELFGPSGVGWYVEVVDKRLESADGEVAVFVDINLYVKYNGEWSKPIFGTGGSTFVAKEKGGTRMSDECFKMAYTDALSVACKALGIGANVYWEKGETKYNVEKKDAQEKRVNEAMVNTLCGQLQRTGVGLKGMLANYDVKAIGEMTVEQFKDAMNILQTKPDKNAPPPTPPDFRPNVPENAPEDEANFGLPFR